MQTISSKFILLTRTRSYVSKYVSKKISSQCP